MNELIRKLAKQAGMEFDDDEWLEFNKEVYYVTTEDIEKFTHVVVNKVFERISDERFTMYEPVVYNVKKYFGVEK